MKSFLRYIEKYKVHHILFWMLYYLLWVQIYKDFYTRLSDLLMITMVYAIAHATLFYTIQYAFIPRMLKRKKILVFIAACLGLVVTMVILMYVAFGLILQKEVYERFNDQAFFFMVSIGLSNVFMTTLLISIKALKDYIRNQRIYERREKQRLEAELQYLKAQVNPHFLFNTINSVYVLINHNPAKASDTLIKLSDLLRAQLYDFGVDRIPIEQEINYLNNYIELEKLRKTEKLLVEVKLSETVNGFSIAPLMLMPFVENCFKHVSAPAGEKQTITISLHCQNSTLSAVFINTKDPHYPKPQLTPGGIGLKNIKRRLDLVYPKQHQLEIKDHEDRFEVLLKLPADE